MISDKERAIIESAAAEINPDEVPGKDFLDELITAAKGGQAPGAIIKAFMFGYLSGRMAAQASEQPTGPIN